MKHIIGRLLPNRDNPRRIEWIRILSAVVVGHSWKKRARFHMDWLFEKIGLLPVVIPFLDGPKVCGLCRRGHGNLDLFADHVHVRHDGVSVKSLVALDSPFVTKCSRRRESRKVATTPPGTYG
jgi:hypothetical protein